MPAGSHKREHRSVLAAAEKRTLVWLARRMPAAVTSDHLSAIGLGAMLLAGAAFAACRVDRSFASAVPVLLAINWFGDSLDGTVARVRAQERPRYGYYLDHVIDSIGTAALLVGLGASGLMQPLMAAMLLSTYLLVAAEVYLATHTVGVFRISQFGLGPTELRIVLSVGALKVLGSPDLTFAGAHIRLFDLGGAVAIAGLLVVFAVSAFRNGRALYRDEPLTAATRIPAASSAARTCAASVAAPGVSP